MQDFRERRIVSHKHSAVLNTNAAGLSPFRVAHVGIDRDVVRRQLTAWKEECRNLGVLALLPEAQRSRIPELQACFREASVPLLGAVFPALIDQGVFSSQGVLLLAFNPLPPHFLLPDISSMPAAAAASIAHAARGARLAVPAGERPTLFMIFDAMLPHISSTIGSLHHHLRNQVTYAGVNAGSESFQPMPCLFDSRSLVDNGVLGLLLAKRNVHLAHGYPVAKTLMRAISTTGNRIHLIDGRPAMDVYQEVIQQEFGVRLTRQNFYDYAVHYPFGVIMATDVVVRIPVGFDESGSIICVGEVPPNSVLRLIGAPDISQGSAAVAEIVEGLHNDGAQASGPLLTFYCAGRRLHLGDAAQDELAQLRQESGVPEVYGALSLGEIGMLEGTGMPEFHNAALVCL